MTLDSSPTRETSGVDTQRACRIVLVDGQRIFRQALRVLFAVEEGFVVAGECGDARQALELTDVAQADVVITELELPDIPGVQLIEQLRARHPEIAILVLTALRARDRVAAARKAGALGYLLKECGRSELLAAVRAVAAGRRYRSSISPTIPVQSARRSGSSYLSTRAASLTARQREVLRSLARGYRAREIAKMLGVSVRAVYRQREGLRNALQLNSTAALTRFAVCEGLAEDNQAKS